MKQQKKASSGQRPEVDRRSGDRRPQSQGSKPPTDTPTEVREGQPGRGLGGKRTGRYIPDARTSSHRKNQSLRRTRARNKRRAL